jgi:hypothetical protein
MIVKLFHHNLLNKEMIILIFKVKITSLSIQISLNNYIFRIECLINWNKWDKCSQQDKEQ